ncbi:hypothetical protein [Gilliamella apicola]|uniref:hypothetical protein n=1 Tax=Gilliamella apicola TaxID=1196095 RepID=UPI00080DC4D5|nr:hypothetical protein [Gilliamella apicola]OCG10566.1 hypothetical protein A9G14_10095 [Gilliamella apicola]ORF44846.1 hypothetical protein B5800_10250 [Gilliamella apicola]ORF48066.1 hypothetical protein B5799_10210 [Gilliamella apicola]ORF49921.1 hypothetical protein B5803_10000 [Gilliamella apicola]ORF51011.1 hypothetical protein B5802_11970 [Gilliamella apicola]
MTTKPFYSREWNSVREADRELMLSRHNFRKTSDFLEQILLALNDLSQQQRALEWIRDEHFSDLELEILIPIIIDIAVDGNQDRLPYAREILFNNAFNSNDIVRKKLTFMFDGFLRSEDDWIYMRLMELLCFLNYNDLRMRLIDKCKNSTDENIVDVYTSFIQNRGWL